MKPQKIAALLFYLHIAIVIGQLSVERTYLSFPRTAASSLQIENKIYFPGGYENDDLIATDEINIYNMDDKRWETSLKLPQPRGFVSPATSGKYLYLVGGYSVNNCVKIYSMEHHNYTMLSGCGPTVRTAKQVSRHNDMLTLLGAFSADFYDMTNNTWSHSATLTSWMRSIVGGITFVHLDVVIGIGGVNRTTLEPFFGAWTFNVTMNKLTIYDSVLDQSISNVGFKFNVAHNIVSVWTADRCFLHSFEDSEWYEERLSSIIQAVTLRHETFIVNASQLVIFDWTSRTSNRSTLNNDIFIDVFTVNGQLVIIELNQLAVYDSVLWIYLPTPAFILSAPFFNNYILYDGYLFYIYNSTDKSVNTIQQEYQGIASIVAVDASTFVAITGAVSFVIENGIHINSTVTETSFIGQIAIGRDIIDFSNNIIWVNMTTFVSTDALASALVWTPDGLAVAVYPRQTFYPFIDVIDHTTGELVSSLQFIDITLGVGVAFAQVIIFPDTIAVIPRGFYAYFYNFASGNTTTVTKLSSLQYQQTHYNPPVIDGVGYSMRGVAFVQQIRSNSISSFSSGQQDVGSIYQMFTTDTMIFFSILASEDSLIHNIYSYNATTHDDSSWQLFGVPDPQPRLFFAVSNNLLLLFGPNNTQLQYLYTPEPVEWKSVPFSYSFLPAIVRTLRDSTVLVACGTHPVYGFYSNDVLLLNSTGLMAPSSVTPELSSPRSEEPASGLTTGELAAAIVVPLVVVIAASVILIVLLMKRNQRKKSKGTTTIGLASKYGDWFVPFEQLTFEDQLGQGSSGQVFKGKWNNTVVALKVIMTQANSSVIGELELMMQMRPHPNVVQLFGFSVHPETQSIILIIEYCDGGSLQTVLVDGSVEISSSQQREWITGVAKGLSHLHSHNIVHRDIAARNVLLNRGEPKLTDFGMSRIVDEVNIGHGTTKSELGPIRWMAPESLKSKQYSTKSDVWSFGILMFEIIARQEPHVTVDPIQVGLMIRDEGLTPVIPSDCPTELAKLMRECWNVSPQSRPEIEIIVKKLTETSFS